MENISPEIPIPGHIWRHHNGLEYVVLYIANELDTEKYPKSVVYIGPDDEIWVRRLTDWHRSFTSTGKATAVYQHN